MKRKIKIILSIILIICIGTMFGIFIRNENIKKSEAIKLNDIKIKTNKLQKIADGYIKSGDINNALETYKKIKKIDNTKKTQNDINDIEKIKSILTNINKSNISNEDLIIQYNEILKIRDIPCFKTKEQGIQNDLLRTNTINNVVDLINQKKYNEAEKLAYYHIGDGVDGGDIVAKALWSYCQVLIKESEPTEQGEMKENILIYYKYIFPDYDGILSNDIKKLADKYNITKDEWQNAFNLEQKSKETLAKPEPSIGMTANEVLSSKWGKPININKTTTQYGVSEQWVYSGYRYIYIDDGKVTAIQQ